MSGIAGIVDLAGRRPVPAGVLRRMADAMAHRGPDGQGLCEQPGLGLAWRRLRVVGPDDGGRPAANEDQTVLVVFNGELFDFPEIEAALRARGHRLGAACDAETVPHLWEEHGEGTFERLRGQFALALWDQRQQRLVLARDRFGICPLHWTRQGDWLLFASEIKALLASGMVEARADPRGISQVFTFFGLPGPVTCFQGVSAILPGHYLDIEPELPGRLARVSDRLYWEMDFPDRGQEDFGLDQQRLVDEYEGVLLRAVGRRLRADVPVVAYSSGGLDSSMLTAMAGHIRGQPIDTFTFRIEHPTLSESAGAETLASQLGSRQTVVDCRPEDIVGTYPRLVRAAESPVVDTSAAALFMLAEAVHARGCKVALTGEGADEWQAGYPWFRIDKRLGLLNFLPGLPLAQLAFWFYLRWTGSRRFRWSTIRSSQQAAAGHNAWLNVYNLMSVSKIRFFSRSMRRWLGDYLPYDDLQLNLAGMRRWHPMNRSLYMGARIHLAGLHLHARGDRSAMHCSVEPRYPFLDEELFCFLARLHPRWKLRGYRDKYLQRLLAERWLPSDAGGGGGAGGTRPGRKRLLHAPLDAFHRAKPPQFVEQLLSEQSLLRAGYFDPQAVWRWREKLPRMRHGFRRLFVEMALVGVISTQLWHQAYIDSSLADV